MCLNLADLVINFRIGRRGFDHRLTGLNNASGTNAEEFKNKFVMQNKDIGRALRTTYRAKTQRRRVLRKSKTLASRMNNQEPSFPSREDLLDFSTSLMPDSARRFRQRLLVRKGGAATHGKREGRLSVGKIAQVAKRSRCAVLFEDRNPGNVRVAGPGDG